MPFQLDGPEKAFDADITLAAHDIHVRTTMLSLASVLKVSQVFKLQDEHNVSYFTKMSRTELRQSDYKINQSC